MLDTILRVLPWILPPVLGACIGYITNAIAIRMLFRPLHPVYVLGIRLPLTPGIIPKQRSQLAESIGNMVSRELLSEEIIRQKVTSPEFVSVIRMNVARLTEGLAATRVAELRTGQSGYPLQFFRDSFARAINGFVTSPSFLAELDGLIFRAVSAFGQTQVGQLITAESGSRFFRNNLLPTLTSDRARSWLSERMEAWVAGREERHEPLSVMIPEGFIELLRGMLNTLYPYMLDSFISWLKSPDTRIELSVRGRFLLRDILNKLNVFQRLMVSAGQYDRTLDYRMPEIIDELIENVEEAGAKQETRGQLIEALVAAVGNWKSAVSFDQQTRATPEFRERLADVANHLIDFLNREDVVDRLAGLFDRSLGSIREKTVSAAASDLLGMDERAIAQALSRMVQSMLTARDTGGHLMDELAGVADRYLDNHAEQTVGELLAIAPETKDRIDEYAAARLLDVLNRKVPDILTGIDVKAMVVQRINSLEVVQVERLLLMVIAKHLKWINLFGGILGALIGMSQLILSFLQR